MLAINLPIVIFGNRTHKNVGCLMKNELHLSITKDKARLDRQAIQEMLKETYWGKTRSIAEIEATIVNSRCYGLFLDNRQIGFARVLSDTVVFAYLMDVLVHKDFQGKGYAKVLLDHIFSDPEYANLHRWNLVTRDAHGLYKQYGFSTPASPEVYMEKIMVSWQS
jgi:GNAT superfamily N-acetyltransferase